jgi:hypothetical protein
MKMTKYRGGEAVEKEGIYLNLSKGEIVQIRKEEGRFPGDPDVSFVKLPGLLAMAAAPFIGLAFILSLPFLGIAAAVAYVVYKGGRALLPAGRGVVEPAAMEWTPGTCYLTGQAGAGKAEEPQKDPGLAEIRQEIAERARQCRLRGWALKGQLGKRQPEEAGQAEQEQIPLARQWDDISHKIREFGLEYEFLDKELARLEADIAKRRQGGEG